jgi:tetratricopeptide (TPR) repeat protein
LGRKQDGVEPTLKYLQLLRPVLSDIEDDKEAMIDLLRNYYLNNQTMLKIVDEFEEDDDQHSPIWWYTRESFLSSIINPALRTMDIKVLIKMDSFLRDMCQQIADLHANRSMSLQPLTVYRCLQINTNDFNKLQKSNGDYLSFNSFLLANTERENAIKVCSNGQQDTETLPVLFQIYIEPATSVFTPFVLLDQLSYDTNARNDILFSMDSVFRITSMTKTDRNIWQAELTGKNIDDYLMEHLAELLNLRMSNEKGWSKLGRMMIAMQDLKRAEELYKILLETVDRSDEKEIALIYEKLATIKFNNGSYDEAYFFLEKTYQIQKRILPSNDYNLISLYNMMGVSNSKMGKFQKALFYYQKALEIEEEILPFDHQDLAVTYDNIGLVNQKLGNYLTALSYHKKALQINEKVLSPNDRDLSINYNNIGGVYHSMGDYPNALLFRQKALQIDELVLSPNDPELAFMYDNMGGLYRDMKEYEKAFLFYEKSLEISEKVLHSDHPELVVTYHNIGLTKFSMGDYASALSFYEKALRIQQKSLPPYHFQLITIYVDLGELYYMIGEYPTALSHYELALEIGEVSLPDDHPHMNLIRQAIAALERDL